MMWQMCCEHSIGECFKSIETTENSYATLVDIKNLVQTLVYLALS